MDNGIIGIPDEGRSFLFWLNDYSEKLSMLKFMKDNLIIKEDKTRCQVSRLRKDRLRTPLGNSGNSSAVQI